MATSIYGPHFRHMWTRLLTFRLLASGVSLIHKLWYTPQPDKNSKQLICAGSAALMKRFTHFAQTAFRSRFIFLQVNHTMVDHTPWSWCLVLTYCTWDKTLDDMPTHNEITMHDSYYDSVFENIPQQPMLQAFTHTYKQYPVARAQIPFKSQQQAVQLIYGSSITSHAWCGWESIIE